MPTPWLSIAACRQLLLLSGLDTLPLPGLLIHAGAPKHHYTDASSDLIPAMPALAEHGGQAPLLDPALLPAGAAIDHAFSSLLRSLTSPPPATRTPSFVDVPTPLVDVAGPSPKTDSSPAPDSCNAALQNNSNSLMLMGRRVPIAILSTFLSLFSLSQVYQRTHVPAGSEGLEEQQWISSSKSWATRKTCQWFGICGATHLNRSKWLGNLRGSKQEALAAEHHDLSDFWKSGKTSPDEWSQDERVLREIPQYVLDYAPLMHLFSGEKFWPCDIADHLFHTTPHLNYTPIQARSDHPTLSDLEELNKFGRFVYLQSDDNVEERPDWLGGKSNVPVRPGHEDDNDWPVAWADWDSRVDGDLPDKNDRPWYEAGQGDSKERGGVRPNPNQGTQTTPTDTEEGEELVGEDGEQVDHEPRMHKNRMKRLDWSAGEAAGSPGGRSDAPAVLIAVDKGDGVIDAFWFYFYSYNLGNVVLNVRFGNHVGDWEHTVIRFHHGKPKAVFFSEHSFGEAYAYEAVEKIGKRPVGYIATGTHAMYATPGTHAYILPWGLLHDITDRGPLWDPALNLFSFTYNYTTDELRSSTATPLAPTNWFYFHGHWGDKFYPLSDPRQYRFAGQYHYVNGPLGPRYKNLGRKKVCQGNGECVIKEYLDRGGLRHVRRFQGVGEGEELDEAELDKWGVVGE